MATILNGVRVPARQAGAGLGGPVLTMAELVALERAPKRAASKASGTNVTLRATPVGLVPGADHMWVHYDDGRKRFIARGGPDAQGAGLIASAMFNDLNVMGQVDPAHLSPDRLQGSRVLGRAFVPDVGAGEAAAAARAHAAGVNLRGNRYDRARNSNSFAADVFEDLTGRRVGDLRTPGYRTRLNEGPPRLAIEERARALPMIMSPGEF